MSDLEKSKSQVGEKRLRFRQNSKTYTPGDRVENLHRYDAPDVGVDEPDKELRGDSTSIFAFLNVELTRSYELENDEERFSARREKVYSFMKIPREMERFMLYGFMQCTDSFLFVYTFLPLRVLLAFAALIVRPFRSCFGWRRTPYKQLLTPAEVCDFLKAVIIILGSLLLLQVDTKMLYHLVKSQSVIKLYIFYNILEVGDRLFSAFGQDIIDALFWTATEPRDRKRQHLGTVPHLLFAIIYVFLHSLLVLLQATSINVAMNSSNKSLLTILMSNNFVELKGSVFKKFDKNNLFQVSCSDVRERFHLIVLLFIVALQTLKEYSWSADRLMVLLPDCIAVFASEVMVDWIKHAFITRFNELQEDVYRDYTTSLAYDTAQSRQKNAFSDHSDLVARRMGFIPLPLGVVMVHVLVTSVTVSDIPSVLILLVVFLSVSSFRILNGILILGHACKLIAQHKQDKAAMQSPQSSTGSANRTSSPLPTHKSTTTGAGWVRDSATSPLKPCSAYTTASTGVSATEYQVTGSKSSGDTANGSLNKFCSAGATAGFSTVIFANSTVNLEDITLNDEVLKVVESGSSDKQQLHVVDCDDNGFSKSDPNINKNSITEVGDELVRKVKSEVADVSIRRADSEPSLINCGGADDDDEL